MSAWWLSFLFHLLVSERLMRRTANLLVSEGYAAAGYRYLIIDDCWMEASRDKATHELLPSEDRFPSGMRDLGNYVCACSFLGNIHINFSILA